MFEGALNIVSGIVLVAILAGTASIYFATFSIVLALCILIPGLVLTLSPRLILEWERGVLLRIGKYKKSLVPGITWIIPGIDIIACLVDMRIRTTAFSAEKALTRDTVPVDVDAVLFWVVTDAKRAILEVEQYSQTIAWVAQTTLRDVIGRSELSKMISDRESLDKELQMIIDEKTNEWGVTIQSVEIRDVKIPQSLEDAMSRVAQADREKQARIILSQSETEVANEMKKAAKHVAKFVSQIIDEVNRMPSEKKSRQLKIGIIDENATLKEAEAFFKREFNAEICVYNEEDPNCHDPKKRAQLARPYRPAIYIE